MKVRDRGEAMTDEERIDSTTIDEKHRILKEHGGLTFILNELGNSDDIKHGEEFAKAHGWNNLVISDTAYSLFGQLLRGCVSIWGKKRDPKNPNTSE